MKDDTPLWFKLLVWIIAGGLMIATAFLAALWLIIGIRTAWKRLFG